MKGGVLHEIVRQCVELDKKALDTYQCLAGAEKDAETRKFWESMAREESGHLACWNYLLDFCRDGGLPQVFENPSLTLRELKEIGARIDKLVAGRGKAGAPDGFLLGFHLEYYLLHPAFEQLFDFLRALPERRFPDEDYDHHLERFLEGMHRFGKVSPELELLGDCIRRLYRENKLLIRQAHVDALTGVLNRRGLLQGVRAAFHMAERGRQSAALIMIDVDDFKRINDEQGHAAGDAALRALVGFIEEHVRASDLVGRYGGDEFVVCLTPVDPGFVAAVAEKLREKIAAQSKKAGAPFTVSIGVAHGNLGRDIDERMQYMLRLADAALLQAKRMGKNQVAVNLA